MKKPVTSESRTTAGSQTVDRALALVQLLAAQSGHGTRLSELAVASGLDRATTYRLLVSLTNRGFLDQDSTTKRYRLGLAILAAMPNDEVATVLKRSAARLAEVPNQDPDTIRVAVDECRERGYAVAPEDPVGRIIGMSVAMISCTQRPIGALMLAGIPERLPSERLPELARILIAGVETLTDTMLRIPSAARHSARWMNAAGTTGAKPKARAG